MTALKVQDLEGPLLARAVAMAMGYKVEDAGSARWTVFIPKEGCERSFGEHGWRPDQDWAVGEKIIEREKITLSTLEIKSKQMWVANLADDNGENYLPASSAAFGFGPTPLIAAMRCFVTSKFGQTMPEGFQ